MISHSPKNQKQNVFSQTYTIRDISEVCSYEEMFKPNTAIAKIKAAIAIISD